MPKTRLISPGSIPNHKLLKNLQLQDNYISNDGGDEGIRIDDSGNVGIGNPAPGALLEVSNTASAGLTDRPSIEISSFSDATDDARAAGVLKFQKVANDTINTFGAGSHTAAGEILGRIEAYGVTNADDGSSDTSILSSYIEFAGDAIADNSDAPGKITFATSHAVSGGSPTPRMTIDDGGKVGIGVTDPDAVLELFSIATQLKLSYDATNYTTFDVAADGLLTITTVDPDGAEADIILVPDGNVGIGVTDPSAKLELFSTATQLKLSYDATNYVDFTVANDGHLTILNVGTDPDLTISAGSDDTGDLSKGNLYLIAPAEQIYIGHDSSWTDNGVNIYAPNNTGTDPHVKFHNSNTEYLKFVVGANGDTTISTAGSGTTDSHLTLDVDGKITLDSASGEFEMHGAGTTAKFADMYAGMILGYRMIGEDPSSDHSGNLGTSFAVIDDDATVRFIAPPSGVVEVTVQAYIVTSSNSEVIEFGLSTTDTTSYTSLGTTYEQKVYQGDRSEDGVIQLSWTVTGLTAGDTYNYWLAAEATTGTTRLYWGGTATSNYPDFIMKVIALPAAVSDFAEYD